MRTAGIVSVAMLGAAGVGTAAGAGPAGAGTAVTICSNKCHWETLDAPQGLALDVKGQVAAQGTPIVAYRPAVGDPAADFTAEADEMAGRVELRYTPYGTLGNAEKVATGASLAQARAAYTGSGLPRYCVTVVTPKAGVAAILYPCEATTDLPAGVVQEFTPDLGVKAGYVEFRTSAPSGGGSIMALNDKGYGGNGTPIIDWPVGDGGNELFRPAVAP